MPARPRDVLRPPIARLEQNGITRIAYRGIDNPDVIPLWFGEGDLPTPAFIREAAKTALDAGETFYTHTRGDPRLRAAIKTYLDDLYGTDIHPDRISVPGAAMLGITIAAQMALGLRRASGVELALAATGIAGPGGGLPNKPVGLVCMAWSVRGGILVSHSEVFEGDREAVRRQTVQRALQGVLDVLRR